MNILLIDNNDSFTRNLEHLLVSAVSNAVVVIEPYSRVGVLDYSAYDLLVISPGPGEPAEYPGYERVFDADRPVLGICLGMQIMNALHGGSTGRLNGCVHGKTDVITLDGAEREVARYHSLTVTEVGHGLDILAVNRDNVVMCLGNADKRLLGYQFHPESFMTPDGGWYIAFALHFLGLD
ncbi:aminodeoxychorismate/anthranilate synthase component II [uncultured Pseudodesulfovibrio sp.]|uniref:aminodeoxychorismate/anthranilate synthase component II n=1 Tax=uncultured Pseudodesulfovibrio sp. TaxID=2035858 RepID=UPI0029C75F71|nr:aminodeoxychorismate/anthranilate synthase component II [uncultured Pseudodesulfovibrio sp.]